MMCDVSISDYFAIYEIDSYTCDPGQYLPANTLGCVSCTYGHACPGGTYNFNETIDQGINIGSYTCTKVLIHVYRVQMVLYVMAERFILIRMNIKGLKLAQYQPHQ